MHEIDMVTKAIKTSDYLSLHWEFDVVAATAEKQLLYDDDALA